MATGRLLTGKLHKKILHGAPALSSSSHVSRATSSTLVDSMSETLVIAPHCIMLAAPPSSGPYVPMLSPTLKPLTLVCNEVALLPRSLTTCRTTPARQPRTTRRRRPPSYSSSGRTTRLPKLRTCSANRNSVLQQRQIRDIRSSLRVSPFTTLEGLFHLVEIAFLLDCFFFLEVCSRRYAIRSPIFLSLSLSPRF